MSSRRNCSPEEQIRRAKIRELRQKSNIRSMEDTTDRHLGFCGICRR